MSRDSAVRCCATVVTAHTATTAKTAVTITCHLLMSLLPRFLLEGFAGGVKVGLKVRRQPDPTDDRGRMQAGTGYNPCARPNPAGIDGGVRLQADLVSRTLCYSPPHSIGHEEGSMISRALKTFLFGALLALPLTAFAQEATLSGTVMDSTSSVLPGVTVTAVHQATGNRFVAVTDGRGSFRLPVRIGEYVVTAELQGFTTVTRGGLQSLVGQNAVLNLQMAPSTLQETVTVTAEAPLLDMADSSLGGNIDPKQMSELPVQGRDW